MKKTKKVYELEELEGMIRRIVREELVRLLETPVQDILNDWSQEGGNDPEGDKILLKQALAILQKYRQKPEAWLSWEEFEAELDRAEAAGELPD